MVFVLERFALEFERGGHEVVVWGPLGWVEVDGLHELVAEEFAFLGDFVHLFEDGCAEGVVTACLGELVGGEGWLVEELGNFVRLGDDDGDKAGAAAVSVDEDLLDERSCLVYVCDVVGSDVLLFGCPAMGAEELEESEFEPFFSSVEGSLSGKKVGLFGSYDWGDGEWMRTWQQRVVAAGGVMIEDGLICNNAPDDDALSACRALGEKAAK